MMYDLRTSMSLEFLGQTKYVNVCSPSLDPKPSRSPEMVSAGSLGSSRVNYVIRDWLYLAYLEYDIPRQARQSFVFGGLSKGAVPCPIGRPGRRRVRVVLEYLSNESDIADARIQPRQASS